MKLRAVIVDDEDLARQVVREFLARHPEIEVAAECANGFEAVKAMMELKPDLLFLDIQMPKLDGFEVLELVDGKAAVIFLTAHDAYALRAFDVHAVDYLLKPFSAERFDAALERAQARLGSPAPDAAALARAARPPQRFLDRIVVRDGAKVTIIPAAKLDFAEAQDDYVELVAEGKKHLKQQTIASLEESLDPKRFLRIHRSFLIRLDCLARLEPAGKDTHVAVLQSGSRIPVSRTGMQKLKGYLEAR